MLTTRLTSRPPAVPDPGEPAHNRSEALGDRGDAVRARDAGLRLATRLNRWVVGGAVAVAGALTALTAHSYHAHAAAARSTAASATRGAGASGAGATSATLPPAGATSAPEPDAGPQPPASVPVPAPTQVAPVVSGGS